MPQKGRKEKKKMKIKPYLKQIDVVNLALEEKVIDGLQLSS